MSVRSGNHNARDDTPDYMTTLQFLSSNEAHLKKPGRLFGSYDFPPDIYNFFDRAKFYRWIGTKNAEAVAVLKSKGM